MGIVNKLKNGSQTPKEMPKISQVVQPTSIEDAQEYLNKLKSNIAELQVIKYDTIEAIQSSAEVLIKLRGDLEISGLPKEYYYFCVDLITVNQHLLRMLIQGIVEKAYIAAGNNFDRKSA